MLGAQIAACEVGGAGSEGTRSIVRMCDGPPESEEKERQLLVQWVEQVIQAVVERAAPNTAGEPDAPVHLIFFNGYKQRVPLDALGRHPQAILGVGVSVPSMTIQVPAQPPKSSICCSNAHNNRCPGVS
jgi:hypothetical protein